MACNCDSLTTLTGSICRKGVGGINKIWLMLKDQIDTITYAGGNDYTIQNITMLETVVVGVFYVAYEFEFSKSTGMGQSTAQVNNGQLNYLTEAGFTIVGVDATRLEIFDKLSNCKTVAIVESRNQNTTTGENRYFVLGAANGLELTAGNVGFGTADTDLAGFSVTLSSTETTPMYELLPAAGTVGALITRLLDNTDN